MDPYEARNLNCNMENTANMLHCTGNITVQDFILRNFSYSFGFHCFNCLGCSLRGLVYNLKIYGQTNETHCVKLSYWTADICYPYTQYGVFPNLLGGENINISQLAFGCYEHSIPFKCYLLLPKCDPVSKQMIHPCKEMCNDFLNACEHLFGYIYDCDYLPPWSGDILCLYHLVRLTGPPIVRNATVELTNETAECSCSEGFTLAGNKTIMCKSQGLWSTPPQCLLIEDTKSGSTLFVPVLIPLLSFYLLIILIIITVLICKIRKSKPRQGINGIRMQADIELK